MGKEYIWFKNSKNTRSVHKRNKKMRKSKLESLEKNGWVQIKGMTDGVIDRTLVKKAKPKTKKASKK